jgi:hypothetical protein
MMTAALPTSGVLSCVVVKNVSVQTPRVAPPPRAASGTNALDVQDRQHELIYDCPQPTPMMLVLHIHYSRASDIIIPDHVATTPSLPLSAYRDGFGTPQMVQNDVAPFDHNRIVHPGFCRRYACFLMPRSGCNDRGPSRQAKPESKP